SGTWYQLLFAEGKGWVIAEYVQVNAGVEVPVISVGAGAGSTASVLVVQRVNVRTGPGTQFETVGNLAPNDVVALTGKDSSGVWLQIEYAAAPESRGWINAEFVQANGAESVPVAAESGPAAETETVAEGETAPVSMIATAAEDGDSASAPSLTVVFSPSGTRALQFSSAVSIPEGDLEDWFQFMPYGPRVKMRLTCFGSNAALLEVTSVESPIELGCGETRSITVQGGQVYILRVAAIEGESTFTTYTLKVEQLP
ncbi:MAG: SH3 domain-containing protein, partial [Chloroflexota bacterium]